MKPQVLAVCPDFPPANGGIQLLFHRVVSGLQLVKPHVVTLTAPDAANFDRDQPFRVVRVARPQFGGQRAAVAALNIAAFREGARLRPSVVLNGHIVTSPAGWAIRQLRGARFIQYLHGHEVADRPRLAHFALCHASATIAVSRHTAFLARQAGDSRGPIHLIPPGVDAISTRPRERSPRPLIVTVARLEDRYKGHDVMLQSIALLRGELPDVLWVVIGDGSLRREYEDLARRLSVERHVEFVGSVSDTERDAWLDSAHVFAMPSRLPPGGGGEGFGIVYLEAGRHELPVVAGCVGGALDAVVDGETGLLVDPENARAVADALKSLLLHPDRARKLGRAGSRRACELSWHRVTQRVERLLIETGEHCL